MILLKIGQLTTGHCLGLLWCADPGQCTQPELSPNGDTPELSQTGDMIALVFRDGGNFGGFLRMATARLLAARPDYDVTRHEHPVESGHWILRDTSSLKETLARSPCSLNQGRPQAAL